MGKRIDHQLEIGRCQGWLGDEIMMVEPRVIFVCGKVALGQFVKMKSAEKLGDYVGNEYSYGKAKVIPIYHPSYLMQHGKSQVNETVAILRRFGHD